MGGECCNNPTKRHYDISMSKRTRKPPLELPGEANPNPEISGKTAIGVVDCGDQRLPRKAAAVVAADVEGESQEESDQSDRKSLKELINGDGKEEIRGSCRNSLSQHFNEEEKQQVQVQHQLQLVKKHQHDHGGGHGGVKLKGMMSRYAKVLSHLVRIKREPRIGSKKNHLLRLAM